MLSALKNNFLKSRVTSLAAAAPRVMAQLIKADLENPNEHFINNDAGKYNELVFYSRIAERWSIDESLFGKSELEKYNESRQQLIKFRELHDFLNNLQDFFWEFKVIFLDYSRMMAYSNIHNKAENTNSVIEADTAEALRKYIHLIEQLKDHPEWQNKVREEIGYYAHMIYTSVNHDGQFLEIFNEFGKADSQYFFK